MRPDVRVDPDSVRLERTTDESTGTYRVLAGITDLTAAAVQGAATPMPPGSSGSG
jgi:hypothetical protein